MNRLVASFTKNKFEEVRIELKELKGHRFFDLRVYTSLKEGEEKIATGKGLSLDLSVFPDFKKSILLWNVQLSRRTLSGLSRAHH